MGNSTPEDDWVVVKTTLPIFPANAERPTVSTERLILRPWRPDDVAELHVLRTQPEVMQFTSLGRVDVDLAETQTRLDPFLPPNDTLTHNCAICWKETGEVIGSGGCHRRAGTFGWPEVGYMLRKVTRPTTRGRDHADDRLTRSTGAKVWRPSSSGHSLRCTRCWRGPRSSSR